MTKPERHGNPALMTLVALLIVIPGMLATTRAASAPPNRSPSLDRFLRAVSEGTPPTARILVAAAPPAAVFYRAAYALYPRVVYTAFPTDYAHAATAPPVRWRDLVRLARHDGAGYILTWALPVTPRGMVLMRGGAGTLVRRAP